jgi:hypothetical protein
MLLAGRKAALKFVLLIGLRDGNCVIASTSSLGSRDVIVSG